MTKSREDLHNELKRILGSNSVYYQKPSSNKITYPAIVYTLSLADTKFADNRPYLMKKRYQITYLSNKPDDAMVETITMSPELQRITFVNHFVSENLHHYIFNLYY